MAPVRAHRTAAPAGLRASPRYASRLGSVGDGSQSARGAVRVGPVVRLGAGLALALTFVAAGATTALAHATLLSTSPGNGAVLAAPPRWVVLQFDVPINPRLSVVVLEDDHGRVVGGAA